MRNYETVEVDPYALYDVLHAFHVNNIDHKVSKEDGHLVVRYREREKPTKPSHDDGCVNNINESGEFT